MNGHDLKDWMKQHKFTTADIAYYTGMTTRQVATYTGMGYQLPEQMRLVTMCITLERQKEDIANHNGYDYLKPEVCKAIALLGSVLEKIRGSDILDHQNDRSFVRSA